LSSPATHESPVGVGWWAFNLPGDVVKLGIDAHAKWYYVARQIDGATPQPVQKMTFDGLLHFVAKQQRLAREVFTCYEAGAFGFHLHRKLTQMGVTNYVVQPQDWDERGKGVKTDRIDALALCQRLDRFTLHRALPQEAKRGRGPVFPLVPRPAVDREREADTDAHLSPFTFHLSPFTGRQGQIDRSSESASGFNLIPLDCSCFLRRRKLWGAMNPRFQEPGSGLPVDGSGRAGAHGLKPAPNQGFPCGVRRRGE
jgi:hypothetical protein